MYCVLVMKKLHMHMKKLTRKNMRMHAQKFLFYLLSSLNFCKIKMP